MLKKANNQIQPTRRDSASLRFRLGFWFSPSFQLHREVLPRSVSRPPSVKPVWRRWAASTVYAMPIPPHQLAAGMPITKLQHQLGHKDIHTTLRYVHWIPNYRGGESGTDLIADLAADHAAKK